jgi:hypothetical protein
LLKFGSELLDKRRFEHFGAFARSVQIKIRNVPARDLEIDGAHHGKEVLDGLVDVLEMTGLLIEFKADVGSGTLGKRPVEIRRDSTLFGLPLHLLAVGEDASGEGAAVVTAQTDEHDTKLGDLLGGDDGFLLEHGRSDLLGFVENGKAVYVLDFNIVFCLVTRNARGRAWSVLAKVEVLSLRGDELLVLFDHLSFWLY